MIHLAGYVGRGKPLDWAIRAATASRYSHVELVCGDPASGLWASASWRTGGVRIRRIGYKAAHWEMIPLPYSPGEFAWQYAVDRENWRYDTLGAFAAGLNLPWHNPDRVFCSELIAAPLIEIGFLPRNRPAHNYTPGRLMNEARLANLESA